MATQKEVKLKLTPDQMAKIKNLVGEDISELTMYAEEFPTVGKASKLKVLKVHNVAFVVDAGGGSGTVN